MSMIKADIENRGLLACRSLKDRGLAEQVTFQLKATSDSAPSPQIVEDVSVERFENDSLSPIPILPQDRLFRFAVPNVTFTPTVFSEIERSDGSVWQIKDIRGGEDTPFWLMHGRRKG